MSDARMNQLLALRYQVQAMDAQLEALMKAEAGVETADCDHPEAARRTLPARGMAEHWQCALCAYEYDEEAAIAAGMEDVDELIG